MKNKVIEQYAINDITFEANYTAGRR